MDARLDRLRTYLAADPSNPDLTCELADALFAGGAISEARDCLSALPPEGGVLPAVRFRLARYALAQGHYADAERAIGELIADGADEAALWHDLAFAQLCQRQTERATKTIETANERFGVDTDLLVLQARIVMREGDLDRSVELLEQAATLTPSHEAALGVLALALFDSGRTREAVDAAQRCLAAYPHQHEALLVVATEALWRQDLPVVETHLSRALSRHPNSGRALSLLGQLRMLNDRLPEAREVLQHAVHAMPDHIGTWHALAWVELLLGDPGAAGRCYAEAYELDRNFGDTHGGLALIAALSGELDTADAHVKRALRLDPQSVTARYAQTILLDDRGDHAAAERLFAELSSATLGAEEPARLFAKRLRARIAGRPGAA